MMSSAQNIPVAGVWSGLAAGSPTAFLGLAVLLLLVGLAVMVGLVLQRRRQLNRDMREAVRALESMRHGEMTLEPQIDSRAPMSLVSDAIERLGHDLEPRRKELGRLQQRLDVVLDAVRDSALITTDADGDVTSLSEGASALLGWTESDLNAKPASVLFEEASYRELLPKLARRSLRERGIRQRALLKRQDESNFAGEVSVRAMRGGAGFVIVVKEITEQVQLERVLRESEQRYRCLVDGLAEGVLIVRGGKLLYVNPGFATLCGKGSETLVGQSLRQRIATRDILMVEEMLSGLQAGRGRGGELRCGMLGPDDHGELQVLLIATPVRYEGQRAVLVQVRDETQSRRIEAELRRNETELDSVLEATSDGILVLVQGAEGNVVRMTNRAFTELFGLPQADVLGATESRLRHLLRQRGGGAERIGALLSDWKGKSVGEIVSLSGDDQKRQIELVAQPLIDRTGTSIGCVLACRDHTEQHEARSRLQQHAEQLQLSKVMLEHAYRRLEAVNEDLRDRGEQLDRLNEELRTLDEMKSNLLGNASHELQTPLVSIRGYTELISKGRLGPVTEEQRKGLGLCLKNIDRLISMIDNLLAFSRSETTDDKPELGEFLLNGLVDEAVALLREKMQAKGIRFTSNLTDPDLSVHADRDKILQVFINLLQNAIKFNRAGGSIWVRAEPGPAGFLRVEVEDNGIGIPEEAQGKVFDRSFQADQPEAAGQGSGLGLAITRDILRLHGCRIGVESRQGSGARFHFTLPRGRGGVAEPDVEPQPPVQPRPGPPEAPQHEISEVEEVQDATESDGAPRFRIIRRNS